MRDTRIHTWPRMRVTEIISLDFYLPSPSTFLPSLAGKGEQWRRGGRGKNKAAKERDAGAFREFRGTASVYINIINWKPDVTQTLRFSFLQPLFLFPFINSRVLFRIINFFFFEKRYYLTTYYYFFFFFYRFVFFFFKRRSPR